MKQGILFLLILLTTELLSAQCGTRYKSRYFNTIQKFEDVVYSKDAPALIAATLTTETTFNKDLVMDIFMPPATDMVNDRPVVILAHGGGFINVAFMGGTLLVGTMDNDDVQALADTLAHWGFVTASIEYRLGFNPASSSSLKRAVWRGAQDMSAAVRFFRQNAGLLGVDPKKVFIGGSSAGAFCALHSTFVDAVERLPESYQLSLLRADLGALHSRPVVSLTSTNPFNGVSVSGNTVDSIAQGVASYWGAIADLEWLHQGNNTAPMIMFHGTNDIVVSNNCGQPFSGVILTAPVTCGTHEMDSVMNLYNMPHEAYWAAGEGHEYWGALNGNWLPSGPNAYFSDIIQKTANYFYAIMQPATPTITGTAVATATTNYTYSIVNPLPNHTYCWEVQGGTIVSPITNGATVDIQFYNTATQGTVTARAINTAEVASEEGNLNVTVNNNTSIQTVDNPVQEMLLYPNPTSENCTLSIKTNKALEGKLLLSNHLGQIVTEKDYFIAKGLNKIPLVLTDLAAGTYVVELVCNETRIIQKVVLNP